MTFVVQAAENNVEFELEDVGGFLDGLGDLVGDVLGDENAVGGNDILEDFQNADMDSFIDGLGDLIGHDLSEWENLTLPEAMDELFSMSYFDNVTLDMGGNCTFCDHDTVDETLDLDGIPCKEWISISKFGIGATSNQCSLLRIAAVQACGCPMPKEHLDRTCQLCEVGNKPGDLHGESSDTIAVTCADLMEAPAVDGDETCRVVESFSENCQCQKDPEYVPQGTSAVTDSTSGSSASFESFELPILMTTMIVGMLLGGALGTQ